MNATLHTTQRTAIPDPANAAISEAPVAATIEKRTASIQSQPLRCDARDPDSTISTVARPLSSRS